MLKFITKTSRATPASEDELIKWIQVVRRPGTTALLDARREARVGSFVTHKDLNKVKLLGRVSEEKLLVELIEPDKRAGEKVQVDASACGPPFSNPVKHLEQTYLDARVNELRDERDYWNAFEDSCYQFYIVKYGPVRMDKKAGKRPATPTGKKQGRPAGSKDKAPRVRSAPSLQIVWDYGGAKGPSGMQFATLGDVVHHDMFGPAVVVQQPNASVLVLQYGNDTDSSMATVDAKQVCGTKVVEASAGSSSGATEKAPLKRIRAKSGKRTAPKQPVTSAIQKRVTKATADDVRKRKKREATAAARGKPLKPARESKNRSWADALKRQAVDLYNSKHISSGTSFSDCAKELKVFPGFDGVTPASVRGWVLAAAKLAKQEPNEFGLVVTSAGSPPVLPAELYQELILQLTDLAKTKAFTINSTTLRPIALAFVISKLGVECIKPGRWVCGKKWLVGLAKAAKLKWRKPYGDARKHPPDAEAQIKDMQLRLAYLMHEHDVPPALTVNFDHSGLHFMQMRGNTWTVVETDTQTPHQSRPVKEKEIKQQSVGDKRQATGTVGTSMAGDVLPGQLIAAGKPAHHGALPQLDGNKYVKLQGNNAGHKVGFKRMQSGSDAGIGQVTRKWLGHLVQTDNHWANIRTSYAILEYIIVPWLLEKKKAIGKAPDAVCILIVDCWYGWKDQDKKKTLITFRHYVKDNYPWLRIIFVPAACTDLAQPADRGFISWLKANMRAFYTDIISKEVLRQLRAGATISSIKIDTSAPYLKRMLANSFAKALRATEREGGGVLGAAPSRLG